MAAAVPIAKRPVEITVAADGSGDYRTLAAAVSGAPAGAFLAIKRGTYPLPATLALSKANLTLRGEGPQATIIRAPLASAHALHISADDVAVEGLQIDGRRAAQPGSGGHGIFVDNADRATLRDCHIHSVKQNGVEGSFADDLLVERCRIINHATNGTTWGGAGSLKGIYLTRSARNVIRGCYLAGWSQAVGWWTGVTDSRLESSFLIANYGFEDDLATIRRSAFEDFSNGVMVHGGNQVRDCVVDGSTSHCLEIAQGVVGSQYVGNTLRNPGKLGAANGAFFSVTGGGAAAPELTSDILVADNYCHSDASRPDYADVNNAYRVTLRGNTFSGCNHLEGVAALLIQGTPPQGVTIDGNEFFDCRTAIRLLAAGPGVIVTRNRITGPGYNSNCILIDIGAGHLIEGNVLAISGATGQHGITILATAGAGIQITGNRIVVPSFPVVNSAGSVLVQGNWMESTALGAAAFYLTGAGAAKSVLRDNRLTSPSKGGYVSAGAHDNRVTDNFFLGAGTDVDVTGAGANNVVAPNY